MLYPLVLTLDMAGLPFRWVEMEDAIMYYARNMVAWSIGSEAGVFRGGMCRATGRRSTLTAKSIIALKGSDKVVHDLSRPPLLSRETLFARDRSFAPTAAVNIASENYRKITLSRYPKVGAIAG